MTYSKAKFKFAGDKASPYFRPFLIGNTSGKFVPTRTLRIIGYSEETSLVVCGNKMPTRCNRWYLLQILLHAQHVSGNHYAHHQELESIKQVVAACGIWCFGFQVFDMVWSWGLCVRFAGCKPQLHTISKTWKPKHQIPQAATICIILSISWWWA